MRSTGEKATSTDTNPPLTLAAPREPVWRALLAWYARSSRDLPWRHTRDPYAILVAEVMLQQTQVERVLPKFAAFLERFPTLAALAAASPAEVIAAWVGLGYNQRAVRLRQTACAAVEEYGGTLPVAVADLMRLPGIGRYTANAIACFAHGQAAATVDTNIRRVLTRVFVGELSADIARYDQAGAAFALAEAALPPEPPRAYDWNQALMDLGATICLARAPLCDRCPLADLCQTATELRRHALFVDGSLLPALRDARRVAETPAGYVAKLPKTRVPFARTSRFYRGRVVAALRDASGALSLAEVRAALPDDAPTEAVWLRQLLDGLIRDGLVAWDDPAQTRVVLPR